jgi:UDP:flavonoid glycosyltransferase YjiC (YdhE family)
MIVSGKGQDKPQTGGIVEYTGVGIYQRVATFTPELVSESVKEILSNPKYAEKAKQIAEKSKGYDPLGRIDELVREYMKNPVVPS